MILIFEGCDKVGKSTLIDSLKKNTLADWRVINYQYPTVCPKVTHDIGGQRATIREMMIEQFSAYTTSFKIFKKFKASNIICDRFWPGEFAYCKIRDYSYPPLAEEKWLKFFLNLTYEMNGFIIYVKADPFVIRQRMEKDSGKDYIVIGEETLIVSEYERIFSLLKDMDQYEPSRIVEIDTTNRTKDQSFNELMKKLAKLGLF